MTTKNQFLKNDFFSLKRRKNLLTMLLAFAMVGVSVKGMAQSVTGSLTQAEVTAATPHYFFANPEVTTDGTDTFYEVDVLFTCDIAFAPAEMQFYFTYNQSAFGDDIVEFTSEVVNGEEIFTTVGNLDLSHHPNVHNQGQGYNIDIGTVGIAQFRIPDTQFFNLELEDNEPGTASVAFIQAAPRSSIEGHEAGIIPANSIRKLVHLKIKYEDTAQSPNINFDTTLSNAQTFTAKSTATADDTKRFLGTTTFDATRAALPVEWTGTTDSDWATATNWEGGTVPIATDNVLIPSGLTNYPTASGNVTVNSLVLQDGASFISSSGTLTSSSAVNYKRTLTNVFSRPDPSNPFLSDTVGDWYLVSSPFSDQTKAGIVNSNFLLFEQSATKVLNDLNIGLATYNNDAADGNSSWSYENKTSAATGALLSGQGYAVKLAAHGGVLELYGTPAVGDVTIAVTGGTLNNHNLIGNPYMAYVDSSTFTAANSSVLSEKTVWLWDSSDTSGAGTYDVHNDAELIQIAPTQGFFVNSTDTGGDVTFAVLNQSHQSADTFKKTALRTKFELSMESDSDSFSTKVFYIDGKTSGFDNGYDSSLFGGISYDFAVFTELLADNDGKKLGIQTLPNKDYDKMVVPVGVIASADKEITFSVKSQNFPEGIKIYLEDKVNKTMTNLSKGSHKVLLKENQNGVGRFYVHTGTFETPKPVDTNWSIYKSSAKEITISGLQEKANVKVFSILGQEVFNANIADFSNRINLAKLSTGVYIVRLTSTQDTVTKKIILE